MKPTKGMWVMPRVNPHNTGFVVPYRVNFTRIEKGIRVTYYGVRAADEQPNAEEVWYDLGAARVIIWDSQPVGRYVAGSAWPQEFGY